MARTRKESQICVTSKKWLEEILGKGCLAACTGQDYQALAAFTHLVQCYAYADAQGRTALVDAMGSTLLVMQPKIRPIAKRMIPHALDWADEEIIWGLIQAALLARGVKRCLVLAP